MNADKILIVEDESDTREALTRDIGRLKYETKSCASGEEALKIFEEWKPDIVFMDIRLIGVMDNGIKVASMMQKIRKFCLVYLTATEQQSDSIKTTPYHFCQFKPCRPAFLPDLIKMAWEKYIGEGIKSISLSKIGKDSTRSTRSINADDVVFLELISYDKHIKVMMNNGKTDRGGVHSNFDKLLAKLNHPNFVKVSQSKAINMAYSPIIQGNYVIFDSVEHAPIKISRNYMAYLKKLIQNR